MLGLKIIQTQLWTITSASPQIIPSHLFGLESGLHIFEKHVMKT